MELHNLFPTTVLTNINANLNINHDEMMGDIDRMIADGTHVRSPLYQSKPVMFENWQDHWSPNWENLRSSFKEHVESYLSLARDELGPPEQYEIHKTTAWFYRKDMSNLVDTYSNNPIHNHHPAQVVGIYFLHNPGYDGTTLYNPNTFKHATSATHTVSMGEGSWLIFPGWMQHSTSSSGIQSSLDRTVIACNAYLI